MSPDPVPDGYHTITPYLSVADAPKLLGFLNEAFGAAEHERITTPDGRVMHAEVRIGDSVLMVGQASGQWQPMPSNLYMYVRNVDDLYRSAIDAGATAVREPTDEFYGDRVGGVRDPSGNVWWIATRKETLSVEEINRRAAERATT